MLLDVVTLYKCFLSVTSKSHDDGTGVREIVKVEAASLVLDGHRRVATDLLCYGQLVGVVAWNIIIIILTFHV